MAAKPPLTLISEEIDATRMVTIMVSNIEFVPDPIASNDAAYDRPPSPIPVNRNRIMPTIRTMNTFIPMSARIKTRKYGKARKKLKSYLFTTLTSVFSDTKSIMTNVTAAAGSTIFRLVRNLSFISTP